MNINYNLLKKDFDWWKNKIWNSFNPIKNFDFKLEIFLDASLLASGANTDKNCTRGFWNADERNLHINMLELEAAFFVLQCYAKDFRGCDILLRIDNITAIAFINKMGGIQFSTLHRVAKEIWQWCEERGLWVYASYIRSKDNVIADKETRVLEIETEYQISNKAFLQIKNMFGNLEVDLFASRINFKCEKCVSWLKDPYAFQIDAFTFGWESYYFYTFPPFSIIARVLKKIRIDRAKGILVVSFWPSQPWYPIFKKLLIEEPLEFKPDINLLLSSSRELHALRRNLTLVAGKRSGELLA